MISSLLLCAGLSRRWGREKLVENIRGRSVVDWCLLHLAASSVDEVIVVANPINAALILPKISDPRMRLVTNPLPENGMSSSIQRGIAACARESRAVLITHGDMPLMTPFLMDQLINAWKTSPERIVAPRWKGQQGNPVIIPRKFWAEIHSLKGDVGCKAILLKHAPEVVWLEGEDEGVFLDLDVPEDVARMESKWPQ